MCRLGAAYFVHARSSGRCTLFKSRCFTWFAKAHAHGHKTYRQTDRLFNTFILICRSFRSMPRPGLTRPKWWFRCRHPSKNTCWRTPIYPHFLVFYGIYMVITWFLHGGISFGSNKLLKRCIKRAFAADSQKAVNRQPHF